MSRVEEYQEPGREEQKIFGDSRAVWSRCNVHGIFSMQPDIQSIQEQIQALTNTVPLHYEAGGLPCSCIISLDANVFGWLSIPHRGDCCPWDAANADIKEKKEACFCCR